MRFQILEHFLNRPVKVTLKTRDTFTGILRVSELDSNAIELEPTSEYEARRSGAVILMAEDVVTIRPLIVKSEDLDEDCEEKCDEDCATEACDVPYENLDDYKMDNVKKESI